MLQPQLDHLSSQAQGLIPVGTLAQAHAARIFANATLLAQY